MRFLYEYYELESVEPATWAGVGVISVGCIGGRDGVDCNFIVNYIFLLFLVFGDVGGLGGEFAISR